MKIQLVNAPLLKLGKFGEFSVNTWPPLGIMYLASYLRENYSYDLKIKLTDGTLLGKEKTIEEIINFSPDILGISASTSNSTGGYFIINEVKKKLPDIFVIYGGVHASALPEEIYDASKTDIVVIGEGEETFLEIIQELKRRKSNFKKIPGLALFDNDKIIKTTPRQFIQNLDNIPFPAYDLLEYRDKYVGWFFQKQSPETIIASTRGCPFHCFFCTDAVWKSSKPFLRVRSPKNIVDELEWLVKNYGIREYFDVADEFNCIEPWAIEVCQEIKKRKLGLTWKCQLRADKVSETLAKNLAEAGCWYVHLGVESGNQRTLNGIGKKITIEQVGKACKVLKKYDIKVDLLLMLFNIWEENGRLAYEGVEESMNTLKFAKRMLKNGKADFFGWSPTTPYPGSQLYRFSMKHNLIPKEMHGKWEKWNNVWNISVNLPKISRYDYTKVKTIGALLQSWYIFRKMKGGINVSTFFDLAKRVLAIFTLLLRLSKEWLFDLLNIKKMYVSR